MSNIHVLYVANDHILEVRALKNELTGAALNSATVTVTLVDADGADVTGDDWPKTLSHVANSAGVYRATLSHAMTLAEDGRYTARITADAGNGLRAYWEMECVGRERA